MLALAGTRLSISLVVQAPSACRLLHRRFAADGRNNAHEAGTQIDACSHRRGNLEHFFGGERYDVGATLGAFLLAEACAVRVTDQGDRPCARCHR